TCLNGHNRRKPMRALSFLAVLLIAFSLNAATPLTRYVDINNPNPVSPYTNWATAATNIQDAVDAANLSGTVLVSNGVYRTGSRGGDNGGLYRVRINSGVTLQSVNGPTVTVIEGQQDPGTTNGPQAIGCVSLGCCGVVLSGFTLTNGAT